MRTVLNGIYRPKKKAQEIRENSIPRNFIFTVHYEGDEVKANEMITMYSTHESDEKFVQHLGRKPAARKRRRS